MCMDNKCCTGKERCWGGDVPAPAGVPGHHALGEGWEQALLQFPFRAQGSAGSILGEEKITLTCTGTGEELEEIRSKNKMQEQGCSGGRVDVTQGKLGVQPTVPSFLHFSAARMINRLQSWANTSSDPSRRALFAEEDLTNWVGSIVFLHRGISGRSGYFETDQITECCCSGNVFCDICLFSFKNWMVIMATHSFRICKLASEQHWLV